LRRRKRRGLGERGIGRDISKDVVRHKYRVPQAERRVVGKDTHPGYWPRVVQGRPPGVWEPVHAGHQQLPALRPFPGAVL